MNLNPLIIFALASLKLPVKPEEYTGTSTEYILFNYADERDEMYANGVPQEGVTYMQIHYYTKGDPHAKKQVVKQLLQSVGFTITGMSQFFETDTKYNHVAYDAWKED